MAAGLALATNFVPLSARILPRAGVVCFIVLSASTIVLLVRVSVSVVPTNSPVKDTRLRKLSFDKPESGML